MATTSVTKSHVRRRENLWALGIISGLLLILFWQVLFTPGLIAGDDPLAIYYPVITAFLRDWKQAGALPYWCSHFAGGIPYISSAMVECFHPTFLLYFFLPLEKAYHAGLFLHFVMGAWFLYLFLRRLRVTGYSSLAGALFLLSSGYWLTDAYHYTLIQASLYLPVFLYQIESYAQTRRVRHLAGLSLCIILQAAMFHANMIYYSGLLWGFYGLYRFWNTLDRKSWFLAGLAVMGGLFLSSPVLLPGLENAARSNRSEKSYAFTTQGSLPPEELTQFYLRQPFGYWGAYKNFIHPPHPPGLYYYGRMPVRFHLEYAGVAVILLCLAGGCRRGHKKVRRFLLGFCVLAILFSLGSYTPVFHLFYHIPGVDMFRGPSRMNLVIGLILSILAAFSLDHLLMAVRRNRREILLRFYRWASVMGLILFLIPALYVGMTGPRWHTLYERLVDPAKIDMATFGVLVSQSMAIVTPENAITFFWQRLFLFGVGVLVFLILIEVTVRWSARYSRLIKGGALISIVLLFQLADVWSLVRPMLKNIPLDDRYTGRNAVAQAFPPVLTSPPPRYYSLTEHIEFLSNNGVFLGMDSLLGNITFYPRDYVRFYQQAVRSKNAMDFLGVRYLVLNRPMKDPSLKLLYDSHRDVPANPPEFSGFMEVFPLYIYENPAAMPRYFTVEKSEQLTEQNFQDAWAGKTLDYKQVAYFVTPSVSGYPDPTCKHPEQIECQRWDGRLREFQISNTRDTLLIISENHDSNWQGLWQGQPITPEIVNTTFQAYRLPPGKGIFQIRYIPHSFLMGLKIMGATLILLLLLTYWLIRNNRARW